MSLELTNETRAARLLRNAQVHDITPHAMALLIIELRVELERAIMKLDPDIEDDGLDGARLAITEAYEMEGE